MKRANGKKMPISIVIPAYNEEKRIVKTLNKIASFLSLRKINYELIVVDDGSSDSTVAIVSAAMAKNKNIRLLRNEPNLGKGYSVRRGMLAAKGSLILFSDADLSTPIEELTKFISLVAQYDVVVGSRNMPDSKILIKQSQLRQLLGKAFPFVVSILLQLNINDTQCGFKLFRAQAAKNIFSRQILDRFAFDAEDLFIARRRGYSIKEVGVEWANAGGSKVSVFRDPLIMFKDIVRVWMHWLAGGYGSCANLAAKKNALR